MRHALSTARGLILFLLLAGQAGASTVDLSYSTYLGGSGFDMATHIVMDPAGFAYVAGSTQSDDFPVIGGLPAPNDPDFTDGFVSGLAPDGTIQFSTYIATDMSDAVTGLALSGGEVFVVGMIFNNEGSAPFIAKVAPSGGSVLRKVLRIAERSAVHGIAASPRGLWVCGPWTETGTGSGNFLARVSPETLEVLELILLEHSAEMAFSTCDKIAVDPAGYLYVAGQTPASPARRDALVVKLAPDGGEILYKRLLGGTGEEAIAELAVDASGQAFLAGTTGSADFPLIAPVRTALGGVSDGFVAMLSPEGEVVFSTYLGGGDRDEVRGLSLDGAGGLYVAGYTRSADFPVTDPLPRACAPGGGLCGASDAFLVHLGPPGSGRLASTLLGGSSEDSGSAVARGAQGRLVVTGGTSSRDFPTVGAFQPVLAGRGDAFVASLTLNRPPDCSTAVASPDAIWPPNGRMVPVSVSGATDPDGDPVTVTITGITQDEPLAGKGLDASGVGASAAQVRASRTGGGDGRVYHLAFEANDGHGGTCAGEVTVCVPHDRGRGSTCGDGGALVDSVGR